MEMMEMGPVCVVTSRIKHIHTFHNNNLVASTTRIDPRTNIKTRERMNPVHHNRKRSRTLSWYFLCITTCISVITLIISNLIIVHMSLSSISSTLPFMMEWRTRDRLEKSRSTRRRDIWADFHSILFKSLHKRMVMIHYSTDGSYSLHQQIPNNRRRGIYALTHSLLNDPSPKNDSTHFIIDPILHVTPGEESPSQNGHEREDANIVQGECVPMKSWQTENHPTCNSIHEIDMRLYGDHDYIHNVRDDQTSILGKGWFRLTWKANLGMYQETVVLKTLRMERDFFEEYFDLHRVDAVAMERLTSSPYILNIYSFCGQSAVNEFADFIDGFQDFKTFARRIGGNREQKITKLKIHIATMLALGIMHIHEVDGPDNTTMVHYDVNPMNVAVTAGGIPKINDFNVAHFFKWNISSNERCGFYGRLHEPWWRSPEEMHQVNRTAIYEGKSVDYPYLDGHSPRGQTDPHRMDEVRKDVKIGIPPILDEFYENSSDPLIVAMVEALASCYEPDPKKRGSARHIAGILMQALDDLNNVGSRNTLQPYNP